MIGYLPADAQERLLRQITELSAAGTKMAADHLPGESASIGSLLLIVAERWKEQGFDVDFGNLTYPHDRNDAEKYLQAWLVHLRDDPGLSPRRRRADEPREGTGRGRSAI